VHAGLSWSRKLKMLSPTRLRHQNVVSSSLLGQGVWATQSTQEPWVSLACTGSRGKPIVIF
jgi:hypothetical protein